MKLTNNQNLLDGGKGLDMADTKKATAQTVATTTTSLITTNHRGKPSSTLSPIDGSNASVLTMSSREIAELCGKKHFHVKRDFEKLCKDLEIGVSNFGYSYLDVQNKTQTEYLLDKDLTLTLVSGYNVKMRYAIIKRWQELETQTNQPLPSEIGRKELALMVIQAEEEKEKLLIENHQKDVAIESLQSYFLSGQTAPQFVKSLNGVKSNEINKFLHDNHWLYKDQKNNWRVTSYARDRYLTEETTQIIKRGRDPITTYKPTLLKKGAQRLYEFYLANKLPMKINWNGEYTLDKAV